MEFASAQQVLLKESAESREEVLFCLAAKAEELGISMDAKDTYRAFMVREDLGATGLTDGFAVPHAKDASIAVPALIVWRNETSIAWPSFDGQPVDIAVALFVPAARDKEEHIRLLSKTAVLLMDEDFRALLRTADDPAALAHAINERIGEA
jgi:PTS system fructose-specific IIA component